MGGSSTAATVCISLLVAAGAAFLTRPAAWKVKGTILRWINAVGVGSFLLFNYGANANWFGKSNKEVSNTYKTPFTPAGWAFSIWGFISIALIMWVVVPFVPRWREEGMKMQTKAGLLPFVISGLGAPIWTICFSGEHLVAALIMITCSMLFPLLVTWNIYSRARTADGVLSPTTSLKASLSTKEGACAALSWVLFAVYAAWLVVASHVNVLVIMTPANGVASWGGAPPTWGRAFCILATLAGLTALRVRNDYAFAAVVAWALWAVRDQQAGSEGFPGGPTVVDTAWATAVVVTVATTITGLWCWAYPHAVAGELGAWVKSVVGGTTEKTGAAVALIGQQGKAPSTAGSTVEWGVAAAPAPTTTTTATPQSGETA